MSDNKIEELMEDVRYKQMMANGQDSLEKLADQVIEKYSTSAELTTTLNGRTEIVETPSIASCEVFIPYAHVSNDPGHEIVEREEAEEEKPVGKFFPCGLSTKDKDKRSLVAKFFSELPAYYQLTDDKYTVHKWCEREGKHVVIASVAPEYIGMACWLVDLFNSKKTNSPFDSVTTCNELFKSMDRDAVDNKPFGTKLWEENSVSCPDKLSPTIINQGLCAPYEARD